MKAIIKLMVARPRTNSDGSQIARFIAKLLHSPPSLSQLLGRLHGFGRPIKATEMPTA
jgi:hypothetical protein